MVNNEKTIPKPDKFVPYSNGIRKWDHFTLGHIVWYLDGQCILPVEKHVLLK
jgi:hypothetical protein